MASKRRRRPGDEQVQWRFRRHANANMLATPGRHAFIVVCDHLKSDFNIGKIFRSADAFGAREVHLIGVDYFDPGPAMGSFKWVPARFHRSAVACMQALIARGYTLFALSPDAKQNLFARALPQKSAFFLGHEEYGLSVDLDEYPQFHALAIPQFGRVQSLNVSVAASIVMYEYTRQHVLSAESAV